MRVIIYEEDYNIPYESSVFAIEHTNNWTYYYVMDLDKRIKRLPATDEYPIIPYDPIVLIRNSDHSYGLWTKKDETLEGFVWFIPFLKDGEITDQNVIKACIEHNESELYSYRKNSNRHIKNEYDLKEFKIFTQHFNLCELRSIELEHNQIIVTIKGNPCFEFIKLVFEDITGSSISDDAFNGYLLEDDASSLYFSKKDEICFEFCNCYIYAKKLRFRYRVNTEHSKILYVKGD